MPDGPDIEWSSFGTPPASGWLPGPVFKAPAAIRDSKLRLGVDPLGGAGVHYWGRIAERYGLNLTVVNEVVDPTFRFMTVDWDGQIRMDPSSTYAMQRLIGMKDQFDLSFACDTDHDRHGIVTKSAGLLPPNHYLSVAIFYLFQHRPEWREEAAVGKTVVSSQTIDRVAAKLGRKLYEVPVGFKWFVEGLLDGSLGFGGEESAVITVGDGQHAQRAEQQRHGVQDGPAADGFGEQVGENGQET